MKVLAACEESQTVCVAFRERGHEAYSCDLQECSGGHPEWHIVADVREVLKGGWFATQSGDLVFIEKWGLVIAHPPCDRLCKSGVRWLHERNLHDALSEACDFFNFFQDYGKAGNAIAIENPVPHCHARERIGYYHQKFQPWHFGHKQSLAPPCGQKGKEQMGRCSQKNGQYTGKKEIQIENLPWYRPRNGGAVV